MPRAVVVGAGVVGSFHAYFALRRGYEVVHVERELTARGASVRNFGLVWVSGRRVGEELEFALRSRALWEEVADDVPGFGFRANGSLTVARDDAEARVLEEVATRGDAGERGVSLLDASEARDVNPAVRGDLVAALHCANDAAVEPRLVPDALRAALTREPGYRFLPGRHVVEVGDAFAADHTGERHEGDLVLVCPGAATSGFAGWRPADAPLRRVRLQMLETEPFGARVTTSLADGDSLRYYPAFDVPALADLPPPAPVVAERKMQLLLQQRLDGRLTIGDTHDYDEPFPVDVDDEPYRHLLGRAEAILGTPLPPVRRRWAGVYSQSITDGLFHCEQVGTASFVVTGAGGRGMTLAPAIAERVVESTGAFTK
ncbi:MAG: TIGR03364 family FAD-dependent oxidoreductase [Actinobacteria bacterium]|nr:TIGR03364 family FAD-dependent oxidoreductase [Actinomycetota bacterium]MBV8396144.1 TIGR03364 family FAD-dependent oxidoreductase [Actinomycetota bacterium]MBV8599765.1 TIGR03364 family FAD-dependent oxidoreductase [Actinomycetota bacterium]